MKCGKKLAVLVGCNYPNTGHDNELRGCHHDVLVMHQTLTKRLDFKWVEVMIDKPGGNRIMPTGKNIMQALNRMIHHAQSGDVLFFHFSGHGMKFPYYSSSSIKEVEAIVPCDSNLITSVDFRHLVNRVPKGATFTILSDSCHSGGLLDKEPEQIGPSHPPANFEGKLKMIPYEFMLQQLSSVTGLNSPDIRQHLLLMFGSDSSLMFQLSPNAHNFPKPLKPDQGILLSGCQSDESSNDVRDGKGGGYGAFSNAVQIILKENHNNPPNLSNKQIVLRAIEILEMQGIDQQHPCLYCSDQNANAIFLYNANK